MTRHSIAHSCEIPDGGRKIVKIPVSGKEIEIGIFRVGKQSFAYRNVCSHAGAPVCEGHICGRTLSGEVGEYPLAREGEILRYPWHGWEFDLLTGRPKLTYKARRNFLIPG